jgi:hypothetical protein
MSHENLPMWVLFGGWLPRWVSSRLPHYLTCHENFARLHFSLRSLLSHPSSFPSYIHSFLIPPLFPHTFTPLTNTMATNPKVKQAKRGKIAVVDLTISQSVPPRKKIKVEDANENKKGGIKEQDVATGKNSKGEPLAKLEGAETLLAGYSHGPFNKQCYTLKRLQASYKQHRTRSMWKNKRVSGRLASPPPASPRPFQILPRQTGGPKDHKALLHSMRRSHFRVVPPVDVYRSVR